MAWSKTVDKSVEIGQTAEASQTDSDAAIVARVQNGDVAAYDILVRKY